MTHHAVLGTLTVRKHGIPDKVFANKLLLLTESPAFPMCSRRFSNNESSSLPTLSNPPKGVDRRAFARP